MSASAEGAGAPSSSGPQQRAKGRPDLHAQDSIATQSTVRRESRPARIEPFMRKARVAAVLGVIAALVIAERLGAFRAVGDPVRLKQTLLELGPYGYAAFIGGYAALQPFGVPGTIFVMAAPLIWPWPVAYVLSMVGTMAASVVGFSFARFVARDFIAAKIPARFQRYDDALARRAFVTVFLLRLIF